MPKEIEFIHCNSFRETYLYIIPGKSFVMSNEYSEEVISAYWECLELVDDERSSNAAIDCKRIITIPPSEMINPESCIHKFVDPPAQCVTNRMNRNIKMKELGI